MWVLRVWLSSCLVYSIQFYSIVYVHKINTIIIHKSNGRIVLNCEEEEEKKNFGILIQSDNKHQYNNSLNIQKCFAVQQRARTKFTIKIVTFVLNTFTSNTSDKVWVEDLPFLFFVCLLFFFVKLVFSFECKTELKSMPSC